MKAENFPWRAQTVAILLVFKYKAVIQKCRLEPHAMTTANLLTYITFGVYLILLLGIGVWGDRRFGRSYSACPAWDTQRGWPAIGRLSVVSSALV